MADYRTIDPNDSPARHSARIAVLCVADAVGYHDKAYADEVLSSLYGAVEDEIEHTMSLQRLYSAEVYRAAVDPNSDGLSPEQMVIWRKILDTEPANFRWPRFKHPMPLCGTIDE